MQFRSEDMADSLQKLGRSLHILDYIVLFVLCLRLVLSCRFALPGKWPFCCTGSRVTVLCGVFCFPHVPQCKQTVTNFLSFIVLLRLELFESVLIFPALFSLPSVCSCVIVFFWTSSGASTFFSSYSLSRCVTIGSYESFSKQSWFIDFFTCGGIMAYVNCSMISWAVTPKATFAKFCSSSKKSISFCLLGWRLVSQICVLP